MKCLSKSFPLVTGAVIIFATSAAYGAEQAQPEVIRIELSSFDLKPDALSLMHGRSYDLELVNRSGSSHDFAARGLFNSARIEPADARLVVKGSVEVPSKSTVHLHFVPVQAGEFEFHCTHPFHAVLGMKGRVDVL